MVRGLDACHVISEIELVYSQQHLACTGFETDSVWGMVAFIHSNVVVSFIIVQ